MSIGLIGQVAHTLKSQKAPLYMII